MKSIGQRIAGWLLLAVLGAAGSAAAQSGGGYDLSWHTVDGGGATFSSGGAFTLGGTAGQPDAGNRAGGTFTHSGGFWYGPSATFSVAKDFNDNNPASVMVTLTCNAGVVTPATAPASEAAPAIFTVSGFIGAPTCTATEAVPVNYTANQGACANVLLATGACTIVNTLNLADLTVTLADSPDPVTAGTNLTYISTLNNNGPAPALDASITLPLPAGTSFVSATPSAGGVCNALSPVVCTWTGPTAFAGTRSVSVVALVAAATTGSLSATASVASTTTDPQPGNNVATATTAVAAAADLAITLTAAPDPVIAGSNLTYIATVTSVGPSDAQAVTITLPLPAGTLLLSATASVGGSCSIVNPIVCTWAGTSTTVDTRVATVVIAVSSAQTTALSATATAASATSDPMSGNNTATANTGVITSADLSITLAHAPDPVTAGANLTYVATLGNSGPSDAQGATITLPLPAGVSFVSAMASAGGSCNAASPVVCVWAGPTAPGDTRTATVVGAVSPSQSTGLSATANASPSTGDPQPSNNTATATTAVVVSADVSITLTDTPDPVTAGSNLTYTATLTNLGPSDAQGVNFSLPLPAGSNFVSVTPSAGANCNAVSPVACTWAGATAPNGVRSATIVAAVAPSMTGILSATATAAATSPDPASANNTAPATTAVIAAADLAITLTAAPDPVIAGSNLTYIATVTSVGPSDAQNATITLPLPAGTTLVSATASAGGVCNGLSPVVCTWAGATTTADTRVATIVVGVGPAQIANLSATATASSTTSDPATGNNTVTATTAVLVSADLSITLVDSPDPITAGTALTYTVTITNAGPSTATGISISLPIPAGTTFVSGSVSGGGNCGGSPVVCTVTGSIAPTASRVAAPVFTVAAATLDGTIITATAAVTAGSPDPNLANNSATTTTMVRASADLLLTLTASATQAAVNVPIIFTASSLNLGPSDAQNVSISILLTPDFRYSAHTPSAGATCTSPQMGTPGVITCTWAGPTAPGATRTLAVIAYSNVAGSIAVNASTMSSTTDPLPANNAASISLGISYLIENIPTLGGLGLALLGLLIGLVGAPVAKRTFRPA